MQLLHRSLGDVVQKAGPLSVKVVANLARQMMDALQHVHSHGIVHRDIKPDNIMLESSGGWKLRLIDFGLARPFSGLSTASRPVTLETLSSTSERSVHVFGTLPFASLNAHEIYSQLTFRDDFESLAYTLLWLLRGFLPWSHYVKCGTQFGRIRQVYAQKKRHTGSTLAGEHPAEFGELVDYARSLSMNDKPDYDRWRRRFNQTEANASDEAPISVCQPAQTSVIPAEPPVEVGQIVLVKLDASISIDGYSMREGHESSYISDPTIDGPEWSTACRPAVVVRVEWDKWAKKYSFLAIPISRRTDPDEDEDRSTPVISIAIANAITSSMDPRIRTEPEWPLEDCYFHVFRRPTMFYCLPSQERVHSPWRISPSDCESLLKSFAPPADSPGQSQLRKDLKSADADIRHDARVQYRDEIYKFYVRVQPVTSAHLGIEDGSIDWFSRRVWFDECVKVARHRGLDIGIWWTGAWFPAEYQRQEGDITDSYSELDNSMWKAQSERRKSITLGTVGEDVGDGSGIVAGLTKITALKEESKAGKTVFGRVW
ncbi:unnamed protein product [Rhizoctonia solani]|uniref:non-specific serine/threonine protein kinase n=1 Tax=Rhizoctonia solani TaxID=456999 RepID=A0A8H3CK43_9AGAM|nr:unnamed protein product [Rhizoctonia solani]